MLVFLLNLLFFINFQIWHDLCNMAFIIFITDGRMRHHLPEWMQEMTPELKRIVAPAVLMVLLASTTAAADDSTLVDGKKAAAVAGKILADTAITAAAEDAIKSVLADTRFDLEVRLNGPSALTDVDDLKARL